MSDNATWKPLNNIFVFSIRHRLQRTCRLLLLAAACQSIVACHSDVAANPAKVAGNEEHSTEYEILRSYKHRSNAYTQGLLFDKGGHLIESSGHYGRSNLARLAEETAHQVQQQYTLPRRFFAEGAALFGGRLYLLTWRAGKCLVLDPGNLQATHTLQYSGEGWGLTANSKTLIMSDGSSTLSFRHPQTFKVLKTLAVTDRQQAVTRLNELEWARGLIFANIWHSDDIVAIHPDTGEVVQRFDLSGLRKNEPKQAEVLNGIAYHPQRDTFFVTGKYWSTVYEITLPPLKANQPGPSEGNSTKK